MNITGDKLLSDLEITSKVIPVTDSTITIFGNTRYRELFNNIIYDRATLENRQRIIKSIIYSPKKVSKITKSLKKIKKYEDDVSWLFTPIGKEFKDLYCSREVLNTKEILTAKNFLKVYSPSLIIIIYLFIFLILKYYGVDMNIQEYFYGIYDSYKMFIQMLLSLVMENINVISFTTNLLASLYAVSYTHLTLPTNSRV